jgi:hypothetical protein
MHSSWSYDVYPGYRFGSPRFIDFLDGDDEFRDLVIGDVRCY